MIEIRLRAAASNPSSRKWRVALSLAVLALATTAPAVTSRAQDAIPRRDGVESLRAFSAVTIEGGRTISIDAGDSISITAGTSSITLQKDGKIILKGTELVIDAPQRTSTNGLAPPKTNAVLVGQKSEIF